MPFLDQLIDASKRQMLTDEQKYWEIYRFSHPGVSPDDKEHYASAMEEMKLFYPGEIRKMYDDMLKAKHEAYTPDRRFNTLHEREYFKGMGFNDVQAKEIVERMAANAEVRRAVDAVRFSANPDKDAILGIVYKDHLEASRENAMRRTIGTPWSRDGGQLREITPQAVAARFDAAMDGLLEQESPHNGMALK